jgi:group I intron endonuclease
MVFRESNISKNSSGIYIIRNILNNDFYVGSAVNFRRRFNLHISTLSRNSNPCKHLKNAIDKYNIRNFTFEIVKQVSKEDLIKEEQKYIDLLKPPYNISKTAGSTLGCNYGEKFKERRREIMKNFKHTEETKKKISEAHKGKILSEAQLNHLRTVNIGRKRKDSKCL